MAYKHAPLASGSLVIAISKETQSRLLFWDNPGGISENSQNSTSTLLLLLLLLLLQLLKEIATAAGGARPWFCHPPSRSSQPLLPLAGGCLDYVIHP